MAFYIKQTKKMWDLHTILHNKMEIFNLPNFDQNNSVSFGK